MEIMAFHHSSLYNFEVTLRFLENLIVKEPHSVFETAQDSLFRCLQRDAFFFVLGEESCTGGQFCVKMYFYIIQYNSGGALLWETTAAPFRRSRDTPCHFSVDTV